MKKDDYKRYDRFDAAFDILFFLPRFIMRIIKWLIG